MIGKLGHFNLLEEVGVGDLGRAYRARDTVHGRTVLVKVAPSEITEAGTRRARFLAAARAASALSHPNIATLFDIDETDGSVFLVFEFVPGETLGQVVAAGPLPLRTAVDLGIQLADALAEIHAHGIVHGDLRPETVRVNPKGHAKVLEAGLSASTRGGRMRHPASVQAAQTGAAVETAAYFSPEQARGEPFDERSDLFSLGVVLYEMLAGRPAFRKGSVPSTLDSVERESPRPPSEGNPEVPEELDAIVGRAVAKRVDDRFQSAASFAAELRGVAAVLDIRSGDTEPPARIDSPPPRGRAARRLVCAAGGMLAAIGVGAGIWWLAGDVVRQSLGRWFGPPPPPIVAMLPLEFDEGDPRYFADGLTEDLAIRLGQMPGIAVVGRSGMRARHGREPTEVAGELQPGVVLHGAVRVRGDRVEFELELIDSAGGSLWRERRSTSPRAIFAAQTEVAEEVARALGIDLAPSAARARKKALPVSEGAYDLYLRGRDAAARNDVRRAIELYELAISEGDGFAELYAALAFALYHDDAGAGAEARRDRLGAVAALAAAADPDLPSAQVARGMAAPRRGEALTHFRRAVELDPSYAFAYAIIAGQLAAVDETLAARSRARARALDPTIDPGVAQPPRARGGPDVGAAATLGETERQLLLRLLAQELPRPARS